MKTEDILCLVDSATTHTILKDRKFFRTLIEKRGASDNVSIVGSKRAPLILPMGIELIIDDTLLYPQSTRTLLSLRTSDQMVFTLKLKLKMILNISS